MNLTIRQLTDKDYVPAAALIARLNRQKEHNITDLGTDPAEIENFIRTDLLDLDAEQGFWLAFDNRELIGVWGLDYDADKGYLYSLGPYIDHSEWRAVASALWRMIERTIPDGTKEILYSVNDCNKNVIDFATGLGFTLRVTGLLLKLTPADFTPAEHSHIIELPDHARDAFAALHDQLFPGTYYSGDDILDRCDGVRKVFVNDPLTGYIYVEPRPDFGEAHLEFIGVHPDAQGQGLGKALLSKAIEYAFSFATIKELTLTVRENNPARRLYERVGFKVDDIIQGYEKHLTGE
jgi:ribosomal protein S18 acetylase RimI-like enzyme